MFKKYGVLGRSEYESRIHIAIEKYVKQLTIEAETMISIARSQILPAAIEHQVLLAQSVSATEAAAVAAEDRPCRRRAQAVQDKAGHRGTEPSGRAMSRSAGVRTTPRDSCRKA